MDNGDNGGQRAFWSGPSGTSWIEHEAQQDALLESVAKYVIDRADLQPGERVLDIGCGTGAVSELAADVVGVDGSVLATDISEPLLARATDRLAPFAQVSTMLGDAAIADWPSPAFDVALSRFGVMFFSAPTHAFRHIAQALRPGGRMIFAAWGPASRNPYWSIGAQRAKARLGDVPASPANAAGPMGLSDRAYAEAVFTEAGFDSFRVDPVSLALEFPNGAAALADLMIEVGPARRVINVFQASDGDIRSIRDDIAADLSEYETDGEVVHLPAEINLIEVFTR